jgi:hypothetical protein
VEDASLNKILVIIGILMLIGGGLVATLSVTTTIDETLSASEDIARKILLPDVPLSLPAGEAVTARFTVTGTTPERAIRMGVTTNASLAPVLANSSIIDETFVAEGFFYYTLDTAEAGEGGLFTFSWSVDSGAPVLFGVFDTDGYLNVTAFLTVETFQANALVWGNLPNGIGYLEAPHSDDYFFLLLNPSAMDETVTTTVFMVTVAAIPFLDSVQSTSEATVSYTIPRDDDYRVVVELPDGAYTVTFHAELAPTYPYQLYGVISAVIGVVLIVGGVLIKPKSQIRPSAPSRISAPPPAPSQAASPRSAHQLFCTNCGQPITSSTQFCGNCGTPLDTR